ncbi:MAG: HEAT repeat domain-containing protein [Planctomycetes bacterium]|nr:HEAT repeat domain-containing protein [Planctomycetota bacterium]
MARVVVGSCWSAAIWLGVVLAGGALPAQDRPGAFVSNVGARVVARCDLGILGVVRRISTFRGSAIACVEVERVFHGEGPDRGAELLVLAGCADYFAAIDQPMVLFLEALRPSPQYRAVSRITLDTPLGMRRFELLAEVLAIEHSEAGVAAKAGALKDLFFGLLSRDLPDVQLLALRELLELASNHLGAFDCRDLDRLRILERTSSRPQARRLMVQLRRCLERLPDRRGARIDFHRRAVETAAEETGRIGAMLQALDELGRDALGLLVELLSAPEPRVRELAAAHLASLGDPVAVPALLARLAQEAEMSVASGILDALGRLQAGSATEPARRALERPELRRSAILALARIGTADSLAALREHRSRLANSPDTECGEWLKLLEFVFSEQFSKQEAALRASQARAGPQISDQTRGGRSR